jgi:dTDP-4-amino-4,6-dideoxygalactose transaminase
VTTGDRAIADRIKILREHGSAVRYRHDVIGINSRLDAIQAVILRVKLRYLEQWNQQRIEVANRYQKLLSPLPNLKLPQALAGGKHVWNQYTLMLPQRDKVREKLQEMGVISMVYYPLPLHLQPVYQDLGYPVGHFPRAEQAASEVLSLPMFPDLTLEEQQQVAYCLKDCLLTT